MKESNKSQDLSSKMEKILEGLREIQIQTAKLEKDLKNEIKQSRLREFQIKYNADAKKVLANYAKKVNSHCYQGGEGYRIWVRVPSSAHHWVVRPNRLVECQPTEKDRDAYYAVNGYHMKLPTETHWERWGN